MQNKKIKKLLFSSTSIEHIEMRAKKSGSHKLGRREQLYNYLPTGTKVRAMSIQK